MNNSKECNKKYLQSNNNNNNNNNNNDYNDGYRKNGTKSGS